MVLEPRFEQEQTDGSVRPAVCISRAALVPECTPFDLEAGSIVWNI